MKKHMLLIATLILASFLVMGGATMAGEGCTGRTGAAPAQKVDAKCATAKAANATDQVIMLNVSNMTCGSCVNHVTKTLVGVEGVSDVTVSLKNGTATVNCDPSKVEASALAATVVKAGFPTKVINAKTATGAAGKAGCDPSKCTATGKKGCDPAACGIKVSGGK